MVAGRHRSLRVPPLPWRSRGGDMRKPMREVAYADRWGTTWPADS